jgi:hypothetical protein
MTRAAAPMSRRQRATFVIVVIAVLLIGVTADGLRGSTRDHRYRPGRAELADSWGSVLGREGQVFSGLGGGMVADDAFGICSWGMLKAT